MKYFATLALAIPLATFGLYAPTTTAQGLPGHSPSAGYGTLPSSGSAYDWKTGDSYYWSRGSDGSMDVRGYNAQTGSMWNHTVMPNGDESGWDDRGNYWQSNSRTGYYHNYGTGRTCIGKGAMRTCN